MFATILTMRMFYKIFHENYNFFQKHFTEIIKISLILKLFAKTLKNKKTQYFLCKLNFWRQSSQICALVCRTTLHASRWRIRKEREELADQRKGAVSGLKQIFVSVEIGTCERAWLWWSVSEQSFGHQRMIHGDPGVLLPPTQLKYLKHIALEI